MSKITVSNQNIKNIAEEALSLISEGKKPNLYQLQQKHGYSESSARSYKVVRTNTWKEIMEKVDDTEVIDRFQEILKEGKDHDSIKAGVELMKLKNRYPTKTSANITIQKRINDLK